MMLAYGDLGIHMLQLYLRYVVNLVSPLWISIKLDLCQCNAKYEYSECSLRMLFSAQMLYAYGDDTFETSVH